MQKHTKETSSHTVLLLRRTGKASNVSKMTVIARRVEDTPIKYLASVDNSALVLPEDGRVTDASVS